ncbi:MAG: hypothetical protein HONBIEJF_01774 [Fimbriimonadaceae bacterium]|nr:hypothetical protein [Fimbriimonadaceae bacterium]
MLSRKLVRDLAESKWQYLAIAAMVMLGVAFFNAAYAAYVNLDRSYAASFKELAFEDVSIQFNAAPKRVVDRILRIDGIQAAEARLVEDIALELPGRSREMKLIGRLISMPTERPLAVNRLKIISGSGLRQGSRREILLEASFATHHHLRPGDTVEAVRGASRVKLRVVGIVQSAEYLYVVRSKHELMAMPDTFGVMFVSQEVLGSLVGKPDLVNEIHATCTDRANAGQVGREMMAALSSHRPDEPVLRQDQPSYQMLMQDVAGFKSYAVLFPAFFLSVAAAAVYTLLLRMVHQQRPVIGLLRSLGFSRADIVRHLLSGSLVLGLLSAIVGNIVGIWLADWTSRGYMSMLQVPVLEVVPRPSVLVIGLAIGVMTCGIGAYFPARFASRIQPADAMRPLTPTFGARSIRLDRLLPNVSLLWRVPLRNVFRQPRRTLSTMFGIVAGIALMMTAKGILDSSRHAIEELISGSYRYDLRLDFLRPQTTETLNRVRSWPGVVRAEGILEVPVDMRHGGKTYSALVSGQGAARGLHSLKDSQGDRLSLPADGAIFGPTLRKRLDLEMGSLVETSVPEQFAKEPPRTRVVRVAGFNEEAMGTVAYMRRESAWKLFRRDMELPPNAISAIVLRVTTSHAPEVRRRLLDLPEAGAVLSLAEIRGLVDQMLEMFRTFVWIMELFGVALALSMIFNMVTINVLERTSEIATLRTIGVSRRQVSAMIGTENVLVALMGIAFGLPFGRWFLEKFWQAAQTEEQQELFTFAIRVDTSTYVVAGVAILAAVLLSQVPALRMLSRLDLAKATKERAT